MRPKTTHMQWALTILSCLQADRQKNDPNQLHLSALIQRTLHLTYTELRTLATCVKYPEHKHPDSVALLNLERKDLIQRLPDGTVTVNPKVFQIPIAGKAAIIQRDTDTNH